MPMSSTFVLLHEPATPTYVFDVSCQGTFPEAIIAFLEAAGYEMPSAMPSFKPA
jgi:hypothetical protein